MILDNTYKDWLFELKDKIRSTQLKAAIAVNSALIEFYWDLGKKINEKQTAWGTKFIAQLSSDLKKEFPDMQGFSVTNLKYCKLFYAFFSNWPNAEDKTKFSISQQPVDQLKIVEIKEDIEKKDRIVQAAIKIPWGHNIQIFTKSKTIEEALFYIYQTSENNWSRDVLALQVKSNLYQRQGKAINNFKSTLPAPLSDLAEQTLKDPYVFDFMTMSKPYQEKDIEKQIVNHITKFILELGKGFAFVAQQYHLEIGEKDYYVDLLFYHIKLKCYVVIELKNTAFIPEYAGKLNFYLSAVDTLVKGEDDKPTIGILLCRDKNNIEAEFALRGINKPMGVSEFNFTEVLPEELKSSLPTVEELEKGLLTED